MKFVEDRPYAKPDAAARRLLEIANAIEPSPEGRIDCGQVNAVFLREGGRPDEYRAGINRLKADGLIAMDVSGAFFRFTDKGSQVFA
jgi:hypothetical protein